jgi:hypothetical protein
MSVDIVAPALLGAGYKHTRSWHTCCRVQQELIALWIKIPLFHEKVGPQGE